MGNKKWEHPGVIVNKLNLEKDMSLCRSKQIVLTSEVPNFLLYQVSIYVNNICVIIVIDGY